MSSLPSSSLPLHIAITVTLAFSLNCLTRTPTYNDWHRKPARSIKDSSTQIPTLAVEAYEPCASFPPPITTAPPSAYPDFYVSGNRSCQKREFKANEIIPAATALMTVGMLQHDAGGSYSRQAHQVSAISNYVPNYVPHTP